MSVLKKCQIFMISTGCKIEEKDNPGDLHTNNGNLFTDGVVIGRYEHTDAYLVQQHLYVTSDDPITIGDFYMYSYGAAESKVYQCTTEEERIGIETGVAGEYSKIIGSTNENIALDLSKSFVKRYCKDPISKLGVDYIIQVKDKYDVAHELNGKESAQYIETCIIEYSHPVCAGNAIIIRPLKTFWSTSEVEAIQLRAFEAGRALTQDAWEQDDWTDFDNIKENL